MCKSWCVCIKIEKGGKDEIPNFTLTWDNRAGRNKVMEMHSGFG